MRRPDSPRAVGAARRERTPDDANLRCHGLQRVVGAGKQRQICGRGGVGAVAVELRCPEAAEVGLVADDEVRYAVREQCRSDRRREAGELGLRGLRARSRLRRLRIDRDEQPYSGQLSRRSGVQELDLLAAFERRSSRHPLGGDVNRPQPRQLRKRHLRHGAGKVRLLARILGCSDEQGSGTRRRTGA